MRFTRFAAVAAGGFIIQLVMLAVFTASEWPVGWATAFAVECAALHNFWWHERWTWGDRRLGPRATAGRLVRYQVTTAATAIAGNVAITAGLVALAGVPILAANAAAVGAMSAANYLLTDRWVFATGAAGSARACRYAHRRSRRRRPRLPLEAQLVLALQPAGQRGAHRAGVAVAQPPRPRRSQTGRLAHHQSRCA